MLLVLLLFAACSSRVKNLERDFQRMQKKETEHSERIQSLEQTLADLNNRIERLEFTGIQQKTRIRQRATEPVYDGGVDTSGYELKRRSGTTEQGAGLSRDSFMVDPQSASLVIPFTQLNLDREMYFSESPSANQIFQYALDDLESSKVNSALIKLREVNDLVSDPSERPVVIYWQGVAHELSQSYKKAIAAFALLTQKYPESDRAAEALFRQSSIFKKTGELTLSKITLKKVISDYPDSEYAKQAESLLAGH